MTKSAAVGVPAEAGVQVHGFLIADIRGYSTFTRERGHEEAARLAGAFVDLASDAVEAHGGRVVEIRGDEVLAVFPGPVPAVRAAVDLQLACAEETGTALSPLPAGVGVDAGESTLSREGYHAGALTRAARLCATARQGEVLTTAAIAALIADSDDLEVERRGPADFKGFDVPIEVVSVASRSEERRVGK